MPSNTHTRVIIGLSGGVDSSVAALLLKQQGYQVEALFMKNWNDDDGTEYCTAREDLLDAMQVSQQLGIELHTVNFAETYWDNVFSHFLHEYRAGRTPNPDILCNREIKFKAFLDHALALGADFIATGHYARRQDEGERSYLLKGLDPNKDQSYFLHAVAESALRRSLFPVGELNKSEVRALARDMGLATQAKKDSTGICFIGERKFKDFLQRYLPAQPGEIRTLSGDKVGEHSGLMYHTIGQRQGLGIGGVQGADDAPWYVVDKDLQGNVLIVTQGDKHPALYKQGLIARQATWISNPPAGGTLTCKAKIRYRQADQTCHLSLDGDAVHVQFSEPQRAITPGQSIVFYTGDRCLGGAVIEQSITAGNTPTMTTATREM
ncbi:MAG: tRNA 2-thiouridine(34) synthase MnmA [Cellvibrionaceae bacterium]